MYGALKPQSFKPESRLGAWDPAVAEEAAYQTGLDTSMLMCPPIVRHANITEEDIQSNRYESADKTTYFFSRLVIHFVAVFFKSGAVQHLKDSLNQKISSILTLDNKYVGGVNKPQCND